MVDLGVREHSIGETCSALGDGVEALHFNDIEASVAAIRAAGSGLAAVLIETTQGSAGVIPGDSEYLQALQAAAREVGADIRTRLAAYFAKQPQSS